MKTLAFIVRRADVSRDAFRDHYEGIHAPLALPLLDGLLRYVRHHVREPLYGEPDFDCMTSFWWRDATALGALMARLESPAGAALRQDEESFMIKAAQRFFPAEEIARPDADPSLEANLLALVRDPHGAADSGSTDLVDAAMPARVSVDHRGLVIADEPPAFDAVTALRVDWDRVDRDRLLEWARMQEARGSHTLLLRVSQHESAIP